MSSLPTSRARPSTGRAGPVLLLLAILAAALLLAASAVDGSDGVGGSAAVSTGDDVLPNPMGGPARAAPGTSSGSLRFGGLEVGDSLVEMGAVALGVTYVPGWDLVNPTAQDVVVTIGQPQVLEGCCPGPVFVEGDLVEPGTAVTVPAGGRVLVQFPLQMHPGMDGWHDLVVPLEAAGEPGVVRVTADFTAEATT